MTGKARGGLGRGLAALIPTGPDTTTVADVLINGAPQRRDHASLSLVSGAAGANGKDGNGEVSRQTTEPMTNGRPVVKSS